MVSSTTTKERGKITDMWLREIQMKKINSHSWSCNGHLLSTIVSLSARMEAKLPEEFSDSKTEGKFSNARMKQISHSNI